jgi:hypothetical protein
MARHYFSLRSFSPIGKKRCARCKAALSGRCMGLAYRGGRGNFLTESFHARCAALEEPGLAARFLADETATRSTPRDQVEEIRATLTPEQRAARPSRDEDAWWNSGELYDLALADAEMTCTASGRQIRPGELCFVRPRLDFGATHRDPFRLDVGLDTSDFDWANFAERLAQSARDHGPADRYRDALERAAASLEVHADRLRAAAATIQARRAPVFGLDRKGGQKETLQWQLFFAAAVPAKTRRALEAELAGATATWELGRILTIRYADRERKTTLKAFRDQIAERVEALHAAAPLHGAHFCGAGDVRASRAAVLADLGKPPYSFVYVNHGRTGAGWAVLVRFARAPGPAARRTLEAALTDCLLRVEWAGRWARLTHLHDGMYGAWLEDKLDPVLEAARPEVAVLQARAVTGDGDGWHRWSAAQSSQPTEAELAALAFTVDEPDEDEIARLVGEARAMYEADDAMDDPGMDVDAFNRILARIPRRRPEHRRVKAMLDELLEMVAR